MAHENNLLDDAVFSVRPNGRLTLPGVMAALARDEINSLPALRPHQAMFWHMFLVQLAALTLHKAGRSDAAATEEDWKALLRGLTPDFPGDEPWRMVVDDWTKPAFMQPPVPDGVELGNEVPTADALDLLITSKNHDLKQSVAVGGKAEDWLFALITLQTGEGYGGSGNQGIVRMNGGSSSRPMLTLAPLAGDGKDMAIRPGAWFVRDVKALLVAREDVLENTGLDFDDKGLGLTWLAPWGESEQLQTKQLDLWFIEVCRRVRLQEKNGQITAQKGTSSATRINAKHFNGSLEDPWAPVHQAENKSFTLGDEGEFDYRKLMDLLLSGVWQLPLLARRASFEPQKMRVAIVAQALARGNSKTGGFRSRVVPIDSRSASGGWSKTAQEVLRGMAKAQVSAIGSFTYAMTEALKLAAVGDENKLKEKKKSAAIRQKLTDITNGARSQLDQFADGIFFEHLWRRFDAEELGDEAKAAAELDFARELWRMTQEIFERHLPTMPCPSIYRHRADARARRALISKSIWENYRELFPETDEENANG
jgi:CRISPR system Cascade subunit CasA